MRRVALIASVLIAACDSGAPTPSSAKRAEALHVDDRFSDDASGLSFPLPSGVSVTVQHFDPTLPAWKFRHLIELSTVEGTVVVIEIWDNPGRQPVRAWFDDNMRDFVDAETRLSLREATTGRLEALLLEQPQSPQAPSLAIAVFGTSRRIVAMTCVDADAIGSGFPRALFERLLTQTSLEDAP